ncbi:MAG: adenylyltransferase/cytidyltransferase family protein [Patescibacteria group bacterium]
MTTEHKITGLSVAINRAAEARNAGKRVVTTNGAFDLFSVPHLLLLEFARSQGDCLCVGVNSDASVRAIKGKGRPIVPQEERARIVAGLACTDCVFLFDGPDPRSWLPLIRPDVHVNSAEYTEQCVEAEMLREIGATLVLHPRDTAHRSTSDVLAHIHSLPQ